MQLAASQESLRDVGRLKRRTLSGRMRCKVTRHANKNVPALIGVAPFPNCRTPASSIW
jgi:hypothetical protein